jgi:hypothetical protein
VGPSLRSISGHREISHDPVKQIRKGECRVTTDTETIVATYTVKMMDRGAGTFQVEVDTILRENPPSCKDPEVIALVERVIREGPNGDQVKSVAGHEEIRYDRENKTRHGRCRVTMQGRTEDVAYKVYWLNQKTGQFQVELEP